MRVYLPCTFTGLRGLAETGELPGGTAFAVTADLRDWYAAADDEELEYAAATLAGQASLRLLDADPATRRRRVVVAADVPDREVEPRPDLDRGVVRLAGPVARRQVACVLADGPEAEPDVRAAAAVVLEADLGSADAQFVVDGAAGHELGWYATQELDVLLELG